ncbi:MAG: hypothetical protein WC552_10215 [Candidatus Omnitrophota bacterium]
MTRILDENTHHYNRVHLIRLVETLTNKTFDTSCYTMYGWPENQIPDEARIYINIGLDYISNWWENGPVTFREDFVNRSFAEDMLWVLPGDADKWKPSPYCSAISRAATKNP